MTHNELLWLAAVLTVHSVLFLTTWDNIEAIAQVGGWTRPVQGFLLRKPVGRYPILRTA